MASPSQDTAATASDLAGLQREFPAFDICREVTGERARLVATRRHTGTSPHTVVTADIAELRAALTSPAAMTTTGPGTPGEYPQVIADDYPGWSVEREDGQWTAWCPAVTVHATTAAGLRAAIEQAITGTGPTTTPVKAER
jgi:hypothetical protein